MTSKETLSVPRSTREDRLETAKRMFDERRVRSQHFADSELFLEPAWDILLYLFQVQSKGEEAKIEGVSLASGLSTTSALRWFEMLESKKLVFAYKQQTQEREQIYLRLSPKGLIEMGAFLDRTGLTIATSAGRS